MLDELKCEACSIDAIALTTQQQQELLLELEGWHLMEREGIPHLEKVYKFKNFMQAWQFSSVIRWLSSLNKSSTILPFYLSGGK